MAKHSSISRLSAVAASLLCMAPLVPGAAKAQTASVQSIELVKTDNSKIECAIDGSEGHEIDPQSGIANQFYAGDGGFYYKAGRADGSNTEFFLKDSTVYYKHDGKVSTVDGNQANDIAQGLAQAQKNCSDYVNGIMKGLVPHLSAGLWRDGARIGLPPQTGFSQVNAYATKAPTP